MALFRTIQQYNNQSSLFIRIFAHAFDTLYIGCEKFSQHDTYPIALGGIM